MKMSVVVRFEIRFFVATYVVLLTELLGERGAHDSAANTGWSGEVCLAGLAPGGVEGCKLKSVRFSSAIFIMHIIIVSRIAS